MGPPVTTVYLPGQLTALQCVITLTRLSPARCMRTRPSAAAPRRGHQTTVEFTNCTLVIYSHAKSHASRRLLCDYSSEWQRARVRLTCNHANTDIYNGDGISSGVLCSKTDLFRILRCVSVMECIHLLLIRCLQQP